MESITRHPAGCLSQSAGCFRAAVKRGRAGGGSETRPRRGRDPSLTLRMTEVEDKRGRRPQGPPLRRGRGRREDGKNGGSPSPVSCADILPRWGRNRRAAKGRPYGEDGGRHLIRHGKAVTPSPQGEGLGRDALARVRYVYYNENTNPSLSYGTGWDKEPSPVPCRQWDREPSPVPSVAEWNIGRVS